MRAPLASFNPFDPMQDTESRSSSELRLHEYRVSTHSIRCRILKDFLQPTNPSSYFGFNPFDPMQDTERYIVSLKEKLWLCFNPFDPMQDTESYGIRPDRSWLDVSTHSIRCRILKVFSKISGSATFLGFNPFDPMQDTESNCTAHLCHARCCFNPFDPMQDTESYLPIPILPHPCLFQPIRSDTGY